MADRWPAVRRALCAELRTYPPLLDWLRRRPDVPAGTEPIGYSQVVGPVLWLFILGSVVEVVVVDVLLPWLAVRIVALVVGVWGVLWMTAMLAGYRTRPHLVTDAGLRVRNGANVDVLVPWDVAASVGHDRRDLPTSVRSLQPIEADSGTVLNVGVSGEVNVHLRLAAPTTLDTPLGPMEVVEVAFWADDARATVRRLRERLDLAGHPRRSR